MIFVACSSAPVPVPPAIPAAWQLPEATYHLNLPQPGSFPHILLHFHGMSAQHRAWLAEAKRIEVLAAALQPCIAKDAQVVVDYDVHTRVGRIVLVVALDHNRCGAVSMRPHRIDLSAMLPMLQAVLAYREDLARTRDLRFWSWKTAVMIKGTSHQVTLWAGGSPPEDGSGFSPCVDIDQHSHCLATDPSVTSLPMTDTVTGGILLQTLTATAPRSAAHPQPVETLAP